MEIKKRFGLVPLLIVIVVFVPPVSFSSAPGVNAQTDQPATTPLSLTDAFSGGLWARLNGLANDSSILDSSQIHSKLGGLVPTSPYPPSSFPLTSSFTNNYRVTMDSSLFPLEDEPSIAVRNQSGQFLMVVGANSLSTDQMVSYVSADQGTSWIGPSYLPLSRGNDSFASDPALGVDRSGTFYYSFLSIGNFFGSSSGGQDDVVVATSADGVHWTNHVAVQRKTSFPSSAVQSELFDKPYLNVGPNKNSRFLDAVYVTYTDFVSFCNFGFGTGCMENATIMEVHSVDNGITWSRPVAVSPSVTSASSFSGTSGRLVQGSMPAVSPVDGSLYVAYYDSGKDGWLNASASVMIATSSNGGVTFGQPIKAAPIPQQLSFASSGRFCCFRWWSSMFPSMDVASDGTVYIAYGARQSKYSLDPADVYLVASLDGVSWSQPTKINDDIGSSGQFFPWLKVSADGIVHIIWGDQRLDPTGVGYDVFYAHATNHGATISANVRVTDAGTDPQFSIGFIGDYFNLAVSGNQVYPVWTDGRRGLRPLGRYMLFGESDIYTARLGPRDVPSVTTGPSPPAGYTSPVPLSGSGLPREAFFTVRMNGLGILSPSYGTILFFSSSTGEISDVIIPNSDYAGAYSISIDEWLSGAQLASTTLIVAQPHATMMILSCTSTQVQVGQSITCTATVGDIAQLNPTTPTGTITWTASGGGAFSSQTCTLSGSGVTASCSVNYTTRTSGSDKITGSYDGNTNQPSATQSVSLTVGSSNLLGSFGAVMVGALAGGAGLIGLIAGIAGSILYRRRNNKPTYPSPTDSQQPPTAESPSGQ